MLILAVLALGVPLLALSGLTATGARAIQDGPISIVSEDVQPDFPTGMTFSISAAFDEPVDRASVLISVGSSPTMFQTSMPLTAGAEQHIELPVGLQLFGIPPGVTLEYHWRFHTVDGEVIGTEARNADCFDTRFDWRLIETEDLMVFAYGSGDALHEQTALAAQETFDRFQEFFQAPERNEPTMIWLYRSQHDLLGALNPNSRDWIGGASYAKYSLITGVVPPDGESTMLRVIPHEVVHQVLDDAAANPFTIPATWFDEGLAGLGQLAGTENFDQVVDLALDEERLPTIRSLIGEFGADPVLTRTSYAASYSIVNFLIATRGDGVILEIIEAYSDGLSHAEVLDRALGLTVDELDVEWREYLESGQSG